MRGRLAYLRERLNTSLWPIPVALCVAGILLALLALWLDLRLPPPSSGSGWLALEIDAARRVLAVIAGSIIGVGGVAFSITMVALTLTSGQYGPKVLRSFLEDTASKVTLGLFIGTYGYGLVALSGHTLVDNPRVTLVAALALALASLFAFVHFIHRTATELQADQIIHRIGDQLRGTMRTMIADQGRRSRDHDTAPWRRAARGRARLCIAAQRHGYVQAIDYDGVLRWAAENDCLVLLRIRGGDFVIQGTCTFVVYAAAQHSPEAPLEQLNACVVLGPVRTAVQDAEYPISQINQLAARALSPGVNDPGTAITCIDWLTLALAEVIDGELVGGIHLDARDQPRLLARGIGFAGLAKAIYTPLRQYAQTDLAVCIRLLESLCGLAQLTRRRDRLSQLQHHGDLVVDGLARLELPRADMLDVQRRYRRLQTLTQPLAGLD